MKRAVIMAGIITILTAGSHGTDRYVSLNGTNDAAGGYANWVGAATQIQWAVDVATNTETVWVSNGTYYLTNQISITNSITLKSLSGSYTNTIINGNYPTYPNQRGVYITNSGAVLDGFAITNCFITNPGIYGAGFYADPCKLITNCLMTGNTVSNSSGYIVGGGGYVHNGYVSHCSFVGNRAFGSGTQQGIGLYLYNSIASNCVISGNSGGYYALQFSDSGGASMIAVKCVISGNNCGNNVNINNSGYLLSSIVSNNTGVGIGIGGATVRNCLVVQNSSYGVSIGSFSDCRIDNCTIANNGNYGVYYTWGSSSGRYIANSIIYNNKGGDNWRYVGTNIAYTNCCTIPIPTNVPGLPQGTGNITNAPLFADTNIANYRLSANSPCVNAGTNRSWMTGAVDLDGNQRIRYGIVDMGAYERIYEGTIYKFH